MWGNRVEVETKRRILLSVWAYAYEFENHTIVSDAVFDIESYQIDKNIRTKRPDIDIFFVIHFQPCTGIWIHHHPELNKIKEIYNEHYRVT